MTVINLDKLITTKKTFKIAGKNHAIEFSDDLTKETARLMVQIQNEIDQLDDIDEKFAGKPVDEQMEEYQKIMDRYKSLVWEFLSMFLEDSDINAIYAYYNNSTRALFSIVRAINAESQKTLDNSIDSDYPTSSAEVE